MRKISHWLAGAGLGFSNHNCRWKRRAVLLLLAVLSFGCTEEPGLTVGDVAFPQNELVGLSERQLDQLALITSVGIATARGEAERFGASILDRWRDEARIELLRRELALESAGIREDSLEALYREAPEPELVVRHLVVLSERWRSEEHRGEAEARAERALERARAGVPFPEVAGEFSEEPGAEARGGLLEPGREGTWVGDFWEAALALDEGEISEVVETEYGFHVLQLEERRGVPFEEARARLVTRLARGLRTSDRWDARLDEWEREGRTPLDEAEARGIILPEPEETRLLREWERQLSEWAVALGFQANLTTEELADQALQALGRVQQSAQIARSELESRRSDLQGVYPVSRSDR